MATPQADLQFLNTPDHHNIAYAVIGNPELTPILFLHGGPGSDSNPADAKRFNLERHCVIMFDQRGCGRSTPSGDIKNNTTQHLIDDIEQLRHTLSIKQWIVYGGSWGAALALEYAKQHPTQVISIILRGSFLARKQDLDWFIQPDGVATQHPEAYKTLQEQLNPAEGEALTSRLYGLLKTPTSTTYSTTEAVQANGIHGIGAKIMAHFSPSQPAPKNESSQYQAALTWDHWEATVMGFPKSTTETDTKSQQKRIAAKLVYAHYCHHQFFIGEQGVMNNLDRLQAIPVHMIHGKNDQVCQLAAAKELDAALPNSELVIVDAGHGLHEEHISQALWQWATR